MPILELVGVRKQFGELVAVDNMDLTIEEGELRGLIGPNGSGKTTLFNLISGFFPVTSGKVIWQGEDITDDKAHVIVGKGLARTFQLTTLYKDITVLKNVIIACHLHVGMGIFQQVLMTAKTRRKEKAIEEKALGLLEAMDIVHVKDEIAGDLPHGHQRSLGIAIALATEPKLLLLDEPVTGMNPTETEVMMEKIKKLRDRGITILIVEHDMKAVMSTCEKITAMNFGKKITEGTPEEVSSHEEVIKAYLGGGEYA
ncbi:ABC transporter ATP-binding protein [Chloroflexota bacterium]